MGIFQALFSGKPDPVIDFAQKNNSSDAPAFAVTPEDVPAQVFGLESYESSTAPAPRIDRRSAIQVPAVKRSRDLIAGTIGTLPINLIGPNKAPAAWSILDQPEKDIARSVTMTRTLEDLLFEGTAWWRITEFGWHGYPTKVRRLDPRSVTVKKDQKVYYRGQSAQGTAEEWIEDQNLIRFDSPNDALLVAGARAIRTCLALDAAAHRNADGVPPLDYFTPNEGADPAEDDDIVDLLNQWQAARRQRQTGYIPLSLKYNTAGWNPEQLQMAEQRQHAVLEIARTAGIDPEELGVSTTSRTYANQQDRRKNFLDFTLGTYRQAVEDRLSMNDVSPRGYESKFNLSSFLRSDDKTRMETYKVGLEVGAYTTPEIRELEDKPPLTQSEQPQALNPVPEEEETTVSAEITALENQFDTVPDIRLDAAGAQAFSVDVEKRTIKGLVLPYGIPAFSKGQKWQFSKGTLKYSDVSRVKLWIQHDQNRAVGVATELDDRDDGMYGTFKVARGAAGDEALSYAEDRVLDGFSVGLGMGGKFTRKDDINHAVEAPLMETSLTPAPSFDDARVHAVAASAAERKEPVMGDEEQNTETPPEAPDFSAVTDAITKGFEGLQMPEREVVSAGNPTFEVNESAPYRFDGVKGEHDFSSDLISYGRDRDGEAGQRLMSFMAEAFAPAFEVATGDTGDLNPSRHRPDMYVDERRLTTPLYDALKKGAINDMTPFVVPKFSSASNLVNDHTEGVEPTEGDFAATSQTITPSAVSGRVPITREVWDQGGNPQVSGMIWRKMVEHYFTALEAKAFALLNGSTIPAAQVHAVTGADDVLVNSVEDVIIDLNFIAGGNTFDYAGTHADLYKGLANAVDASGRKLLPQYGPTNANGQSRAKFRSLDVSGTEFQPVASLGATGSTSKSYLLDTSSVHVWNSAPQRLEFQYRVAYVDLGIWGYVASAVTDLAGVQRLDYTAPV